MYKYSYLILFFLLLSFQAEAQLFGGRLIPDSRPRPLVSALDCLANAYGVANQVPLSFSVFVPYTGGNGVTYLQGNSINLGNGTVTAKLKAGTLSNGTGGNLEYLIEGTTTEASTMILPVNFGTKSCNVTIFVYEPILTTLTLTAFTFHDTNRDCVRDTSTEPNYGDELGLSLKVFDLDDSYIGGDVSSIDGQFSAVDLNLMTDKIYYFIIDDNFTSTDTIPTLPNGWSAPNARQYFYYDGSIIRTNSVANPNLLDSTWSNAFPFRVCLQSEINSLDCANATNTGTLFAGVSASGVSSEIAYAGGNGAAYSGQTVTSTGVTGLTATLTAGTFANGDGTLTYTITGTPSGTGTASFEINIGGHACNLIRNVVVLPTFNCSSKAITTNNWVLTNGSSYIGSITVPYTGGTAGVGYPQEIIISNGITFTRVAGTYAGGAENITYNFNGQYTGTSNVTFNIILDSYAGSCNVVIFDALRSALAQAGCASCTAYDNAAVNAPVNITKAEYDKILLISGASHCGATESFMNSGVSNGAVGNAQTWSYDPSLFGGPYFASANYLVAFSIKSKTPSVFAAVSRTVNGMRLKFSSNQTSGFSDYTLGCPNISIADQTRYYFVIKRVSGTIPTTPKLAIYNPNANNDLIGAENGTVKNMYYGSGNTNSPSTLGGVNQYIFFQGIQIPTKQW